MERWGAHPTPNLDGSLSKPRVLSAFGEDGRRWEVLVGWLRVYHSDSASTIATPRLHSVGLRFPADSPDLIVAPIESTAPAAG